MNLLHFKFTKLTVPARGFFYGKNEVLSDIVEEFNLETNDGKDMKKYSKLLEDSIDNIIGKKEEKGVASLFTKGGTTLQKSLFKGIEDFELISFIVIK